MKFRSLAASALIGLPFIVNAQAFSDDFSSAAQLSYYGPDRSAPQSAVTGTFFGKTALKMTIWDNPGVTDPFYNFQGLQRYADVAHTQGFGITAQNSNLSMDVYIPSSWNATTGGTADRRGGDLWARFDDVTQTVGNDAYPTLGFYNEGNGNGVGLEVFRPYTGNIEVFSLSALTTLGAAPQLNGWNNLRMRFVNNTVEHYLNNVLVYTDSDAGWNNVASLEGAFVQGWRSSAMIGSGSTYDVVATNLTAVPEPATMTALALGGLALLRRRKTSV
ncbi:MAG: PEP-CTERM sorting domain-containing protein [Armatimonadota bacterium]